MKCLVPHSHIWWLADFIDLCNSQRTKKNMADIKIIKTSLVTNVLTSSFILLLQLIMFGNRQLINTLLHTNKHMYTMKYSNTKYIEHLYFFVSMLHWKQYVSVIWSRRKSSQPNYRPCNEPPAVRSCRWMFMKWARNAVHSHCMYPHTISLSRTCTQAHTCCS